MYITRILSNNNSIIKNDGKLNQVNLPYNADNSLKELITYPTNYYINKLSFKGTSFKEQLAEYFKKDIDEEQLYSFLYTEFKRKAFRQNVSIQLMDEMIQNALINIFIKIEEMKQEQRPNEDIIKEICKSYDELKVQQQDYISNFWVKSIYEPINGYEQLSIADTIPDDEAYKLTYLSEPSDKAKEKKKKKVASVLSKSNLDERSENMLKDRFSPMTFPELAKKYHICRNLVILNIKRSILKTQIANKALPQEIWEKIRDISKIFQTDYDTVQNMILTYPYILGRSYEEIKNHRDSLIKAFGNDGLTLDDYRKACIKFPVLLCRNPKTIEGNVKTFVNGLKDEGLTITNYIQACIRQPSLFTHSPETLRENITGIVQRYIGMGLNTKTYITCCLKDPALFAMTPNKIEKNINDTVNTFSSSGLTIEKYIKAAIKDSALFQTPAKTIENNVIEITKRFENNGLNIEKYINACLKNPSLFYQSPNTIEKNIREVVKEYETFGLTTDDYIKSAIKKPALFCITPQRVKQNISSVVETFNDNGLSYNQYIKMAVKQPQLFYQSPDTIIQNAQKVIDTFKNNGLTADNYINCCIKQPPLLCLSPQKIEDNVQGLVQKYSNMGLTTDDYIQVCTKLPSLFECSPNTISEHINVRLFSLYNTGKEIKYPETIKQIISNGIELNFSSEYSLLRNLIIPKIFEKEGIPKGFMKQRPLEKKFKEYLSVHSDKTYEINIKNFETETDTISILINYLNRISQEITGEDNLFKLNIL